MRSKPSGKNEGSFLLLFRRQRVRGFFDFGKCAHSIIILRDRPNVPSVR